MASEQRYGRVAIGLHWLIALLILGNLALGHYMVGAPMSSKPVLVPVHIWIGLSVFALSLFRLFWRLTHPKPPYPSKVEPWEARLAGLVQALFYVLMLGLPVLGWLILSSNPPNPHRMVRFLGLVPLPFVSALQNLAQPEQKVIHDQFVVAHATGAWIMVGALALHMAGIVKHHLFDRIPIINRMVPGRA